MSNVFEDFAASELFQAHEMCLNDLKLEVEKRMFAAFMCAINEGRFSRYCIMDFLPETEEYKTGKCRTVDVDKQPMCHKCLLEFVHTEEFKKLIERAVMLMNGEREK